MGWLSFELFLLAGRDAPGNKADRRSRDRSFTSWAHIDPLRVMTATFGGAVDSSALRYRRPVHLVLPCKMMKNEF